MGIIPSYTVMLPANTATLHNLLQVHLIIAYSATLCAEPPLPPFSLPPLPYRLITPVCRKLNHSPLPVGTFAVHARLIRKFVC